MPHVVKIWWLKLVVDNLYKTVYSI